jgi:hypothetical protein
MPIVPFPLFALKALFRIVGRPEAYDSVARSLEIDMSEDRLASAARLDEACGAPCNHAGHTKVAPVVVKLPLSWHSESLVQSRRQRSRRAHRDLAAGLE